MMGGDDYTILPPRNLPNAKADPDKISKFQKMWDRSNNYGGEIYDLLDKKLRIMLNICHIFEILPEQFHSILPQILKGRAQQFYIYNIGPRCMFYQMYWALKNHFETETNRIQYFNEWTNISFNSMRADPRYAEKTPQDILQAMFDRLLLCQQALGQEYAGEPVLRMNIVQACKGVPEFKHTLYTPSRSVERLIQDLRSSLEISLQRGTARTSHQYPVDDNGRGYDDDGASDEEYNGDACRSNFVDRMY